MEHEKLTKIFKELASNELEEKNRTIGELSAKLNVLENTFGQKEDNIRNQRSNWEKEKAILN